MIPFFVADRPMSLRILKGLNLKDYPGVKIGIMAHANTTDNFQRAYRDYPCEDLKRCDAIDAKPCPYKTERGRNNCKHRQLILDRTVKMCDSGVFTKEGAMLSYEKLFAAYDRMKVEYGIMIDVLHDDKATVESAIEARKVYELRKHKFNLVVVAQGKTEREYLDCYNKLKRLGFEHIAIGGLLKRNQNTVRYVKVGSNELLFDVLKKIKDKYSPNWLFALGCLNPSRIENLKKLDVWADYKGWIFQYKKRNESLDLLLKGFEENSINVANKKTRLKELVAERNDCIINIRESAKELYKGKNNLRKAFKDIERNWQNTSLVILPKFRKMTSRGILNESEEKFVVDLFKKANVPEAEIEVILADIRSNRERNKNIKDYEEQINIINYDIAEQINVIISKPCLSSELKKTYQEIYDLIKNKNEHSYRLEQVRRNIEQKIFALLI